MTGRNPLHRDCRPAFGITLRIGVGLMLFTGSWLQAQTAAPPPAPVPAPTVGQTSPAPTASAPQPATAAVPFTEEFTKAVFFGKKFAERRDYTEAYQQFAKADALLPDQPAVLYDMAVVLARSGRYSEAQSKVDRYLQLFPNGAERPLVAKLQLELEFQRELQKKRQADQDYAELFSRGKFLYSKNDLEGALKQFQDAEQRKPTDAAAVFNEAVVYEKMADFARAAERFHRYEELESDPAQKTVVGQRILSIESEISDMKAKIICPFCGLRLLIGQTWCPRCWHGPYLTAAPIWSSRACMEGASATRTLSYSDGRVARNDVLACQFNGTMLEALRYSAAKQHAVQDARKSEGWTYTGDIIQGWKDKLGNEIHFTQGPDYLERTVTSAGDILLYAAHKAGDSNLWLLDREDVILDGQKYTNHYTFDAQNRIVQQQTQYQNTAGCNHLISGTADYTYQNDVLNSVHVTSGYDGYTTEGLPHTSWQATVTYTYDATGRATREDLALTAFDKTYTTKPYGAQRDEIQKIYPSIRYKRPMENMMRTGDLCGAAGSAILGNQVDLRPFYALSPNLAIPLGFGVTKASVTLTYPDSYKLH